MYTSTVDQTIQEDLFTNKIKILNEINCKTPSYESFKYMQLNSLNMVLIVPCYTNSHSRIVRLAKRHAKAHDYKELWI